MNDKVIIGFIRAWGGFLWLKIYKSNIINIWFLLCRFPQNGSPVIIEGIL